MAVLVDASTILAMSAIGELDVLRALFGKVVISEEVRDEILVRDGPIRDNIEEALKNWLIVSKAPRGSGPLTGLGKGERSLIALYRKGDLLVIDDALARRTALARGLEFTGLLGILIAAVDSKRLMSERGIAILEKLASGDFHMSVQPYIETKRRLERTR